MKFPAFLPVLSRFLCPAEDVYVPFVAGKRIGYTGQHLETGRTVCHLIMHNSINSGVYLSALFHKKYRLHMKSGNI